MKVRVPGTCHEMDRHAPLILMCVAAVGQAIVAMVAGEGTVRSADRTPSPATG